MKCVQGYDKEITVWRMILWIVSIACNGTVCVHNACTMQGNEGTGAVICICIGLIIVAKCLLAAADMDLRTCTVYNYLWWLIGGVGLFLFAVQAVMQGRQLYKIADLVIFLLLQEFFFYKMYGRADCHGFAVCAVVGDSFGMGLREFLLHMLLAFGLLGMVQLIKKNVGTNGNLKKPVPFVPYLAVTFWVNLGAYLCV